MRRLFRSAFVLLFLLTACLSPKSKTDEIKEQLDESQGYNTANPPQPKLVVGIVIDQFRPDYLYRFSDQFSEGGVKRMIKQGFYNRNTHYNYIPTFTGPGHTSIYTGTTPAVHGIVGNSWYSRELGRTIYCAEDSLARGVGTNSDAGKMSSRNLLSTNISDALKLSTNKEAKVVGISLKDRGAAFPAGHIPDGAYWFDKKYGKFISSTFFMDELPAWVEEFNDRRLPQQYMDSTWNTLLAMEEYEGGDDTPYERVLKGKKAPVFPYNLAELKESNGNYGLLSFMPFANTVVTELAKAAIEGEQMGQDKIPDLLAISYSSTDLLGHSFGPRSVEIQDMYIRLDREIESLLNYLDATVGQGEYLVFMTGDHAAAEVPQFLIDQKIPAGYFSQSEIAEKAEDFLDRTFQVEGLLEYVINQQVYLNHEVVLSHNLKLIDVQQQLASYLRDIKGVASVFTAKELQAQVFSNGMSHMLQNGYFYKNSGDVFMVLEPGWMDYGKYGTTHGSGYTYDTHVPLLWYGWKIKEGSSSKKQNITDIAPTISFLLGISLPNGATGEPILEITETE